MASLDEERYLRHIWLLGEGGLFVLRGVVSREATKSGRTLESLLQNGRARFTGVLQKQQHCLFPTPTTVNVDTYTWDMSLLFVVLKKLFWSGLSVSERASLKTLKTYRNDLQGHPPILSMNASDYSSNRQLLEQALRQLASGINRNVEIESIIKRTATGRIDSGSILTHIRVIYDFQTSFLTAVEEMLQRVISSIQGDHGLVLSKLNNMDIKHVWKTKHDFSRELKVIIQAECENKEKQKEANDLLFDFVKIIQSDIKIESDKIRRIIAVRMEWYGEPTLQLLDDLIEWFSDIANLSNGIGNACSGSIVIPIFCSSVPDILTLLKYMNGDQNKQHLSRISSTVRVLLGFPCSLSWKVEPTSFRSALSTSLLSPGKEKRSNEENVLVLPINVTNIEQLTDVWKMLEDEQKSSNMEKISATLSQTFRVETYVDDDHLQSILYERVLSPGKEKRSKEEKDLALPINVTNKEQMTDIRKMLRDEQRSSNIEKISATLSQIFGEAIRLKTYVDNDELQTIIHVYERGDIESQPDNSTDDQSSDKEHKKQIQRKFGSSDSDAGHDESQPDKSTDDLSSDEEHKRQIQKKFSSSKSDEGHVESQPDNSTDDLLSDEEYKRQIQKKFSSSKSDEGRVESQPDKSTDDLSSDEEHKRQIQKMFSSSKSDEDLLTITDVSEVHDISKEEEANWVKSVLALKITADHAMTYLAWSIFKQFYNSLNIYEKMNLEHLLDIAQNRHKDYTLRRVKDHRVWVVNSPECKSLLEKLVSAHWDPANVEWDNIGDTNVKRYWKIAKLYMPHGNKDSTCPEDLDMIAIFHMLKNFKVKDFAEERKEIDEMIGHVNYLLRSPDNKISEAEMSSILKNIYQFMKSTELSEDIKSKTNDKLQKVQLISNCDEWYKRILPKQKSNLAFERDRTNQFLNITEKLLVEFTKKNRCTMEQAYNAPLSDKIKGATAGRDIGAIEGTASLVYGSTLGATASGTSHIWKGFNKNPPPSQSSDEVHQKLIQRKLRLPDIDGGYIKSHPDKSTDDQSSNKEHKKQIHRRLRSSDYDEDLLSITDVSEVRGISKEEEVYWVKSVLALKITADDTMTYLARIIFKQFFDSLTSSEKQNLQHLLDIAQNRHEGYTLTRVKDLRAWVVNSPECRSLLKKLVSAHWDPAYVEWNNIGDVDVDSYWKIAKLYMPPGNKDSTCPEDTDMLAMFYLLRNFKVEDFVEERIEIDQMIRHRNYLIFDSQENRISEMKMTEIFKNINKFLESNKLSNGIKSKTKDRLEKVQLISNSGTWNLYKRVLPKQREGLSVELDRTEQFLNSTQRLLFVFKIEREFAMIAEYNHPVSYMFRGALAGAASGAFLGTAGLVIGGVSGAAFGALRGLFKW